MAIIFYTHLLIPSSFADDTGGVYPNLWAAQIRFPLSQLARQPPHTIDAASELAWRETYPDHPYQVVTFTPAGHQALLTGAGALDIHGYRCLSETCYRKNKSRVPRMGYWRMPMAQWSEFRLNNSRMLCPSCKILVTRTLISHPGTFEAIAQAAFGAPIFSLWDKPMRQLGPNGFIPTVLTHIDGESTADNIITLQAGQHRYRRFLQLMPGDAVPILVPTIDIDLFWHTHQLDPISYDTYCRTHIGRRVFHDDSIASSPRNNALSQTTTAWAHRYTEAFLDPTSLQKQTAIRTAKSDLATARATQNTQLAAFDAEHEPITSTHAAATARLKAAHTAAFAARNDLSRLDVGLRVVHQQISAQSWLRWLRSASKTEQRRAQLTARRELLERARATLITGELASRDAECMAAGGELEACKGAWEESRRARARLQVEWYGRVNEAEGRVAAWGGSMPEFRTAAGGPMSAVVGTEACVAPPIVGTKRTDEHLDKTWRDSWARKRKPMPPSHEIACGGFVGANWALYGFVYASYSGGGGGGGGCGGGGGGGCGGGGCGGGGCGGGGCGGG